MDNLSEWMHGQGEWMRYLVAVRATAPRSQQRMSDKPIFALHSNTNAMIQNTDLAIVLRVALLRIKRADIEYK